MSNEKTSTLTMSEDHLKHLEDLGKQLDKARGAGTANFAGADVCAEYKKIKGVLQKALPFIRFIPKFGKQVADAIELLMSIADNFCPK